MDYKKLPFSDPLEKPQELKGLKILCLCAAMIMLGGGLAFAIIVIGLTPQFLTDQDCLALQNESFINGTAFGGEYAIAIITDQVTQCKTLPISYAGMNYTLVAIECLNLGEQNG